MICIVLKILKKGSLAVFLSQEQGKIIAHYKISRTHADLFAGALVLVEVVDSVSSKYPFFNSVEIVSSPTITGIRSYYFLSFFLDLVYLFLPQGQPDEEVFECMLTMVRSDVVLLCEKYSFIGAFYSLTILRLLGFFLPESLYTFSCSFELDLKKGLFRSAFEDAALRHELEVKYDASSTQIFLWILQELKVHPQSKKIEKLLVMMRSEKIWGSVK
ncbi:hypothetical protein FJ366_01565 [Candidatus Dependentiae bacterium]|nr:hypothetical protein [Candidatus Dependentiae bacterium]